MVVLNLFGAMDLRDGENTPIRSILVQPKRIALLAYLATARPSRVSTREEILGILWPDRPEEKARQALNQALYVLRRGLGPDIVTSRGNQTVTLSRDGLACDASSFDELIDRGDAEGAIRLYRGEFLEGFYLDGAREFHEWLDRRRAHYQRRATDAAVGLARAAEGEGRADEAVRWTRLAAGWNPYDEAIHRDLLERLGDSGNVGEALRHAEGFRVRLQRDLGADPSADTLRLVAVLRDRSAGADIRDAEAGARPFETTARGADPARDQPRQEGVPLSTHAEPIRSRRPFRLAGTLAMATVVATLGPSELRPGDVEANNDLRQSLANTSPSSADSSRAAEAYREARALFALLDGPSQERALDVLDRAMTDRPDFPEALGLSAFLLFASYERSGLRDTHLLDSAAARATRAYELGPDVPMAAVAMGYLAASRDSLAAGLPYWEHAVSDRGDAIAAGAAALLTGHALVSAGDLGPAIAHYELAAQSYPMHRANLWTYAVLMARLDPEVGFRRLDSARAEVRSGGYEPSDERYQIDVTNLYGNLTWLALLSGNLGKARAFADTALSGDSRQATILALPGDVALFQGNLNQAEAHLRTAAAALDGPLESGNAASHSWGRSVRTSLGALLIQTGGSTEGQRLLRTQARVNSAAQRELRALHAAATYGLSGRDLEFTFSRIDFDQAVIQLHLGDRDAALDRLEGISTRQLLAFESLLRIDPLLDALRSEERFQALTAEAGRLREMELQRLRVARDRLGL